LQLVFHPTTRQRGLERALRESEERYRHLIGNLGEGFWMGGNNGGTADVNQALLDLLGYSREAMLDHPLTEFAEASERDRLRRCLNDLEEGEASTFETTLIRQDGRPLPVTVRMVALPDPSTGLPALLAFITDLSAQQTLRDRLRRETGLNEAILGSLPGIFFLVGPGLALTRWNSNLCHQTGLAALELAGLPAPELFDAPDREAVRTLLDGAQAEGGGEMEAHLVAGDDRRIPFRLSAAPISLGESGFLAVLGVDITERKALEADLERMATVDGLTGAWNRAAMERQLVTEIERSRRYGNRLSLLLLDLDRFGTVNDHFGREIGDQVLRDVVASIQANKRATDFLGRWGGDQFLLLAPDTNLTGATTLAENLHVLIGSQDFDPVALIQCSTGVTAYHPGDSLTHLLERLDGILHEAKRRGRNQVMVAEP
jgi:diguanylate cyclase (GGDEF)-like protein/PAS domain S-box-containing protein